ncbi:MAG TPA: hypothetical protein VMZ53_15820 [Kofleriaceae bacterium]|nr:hypothetical protein [Kofleriaceae bacterium]
MRSNVAKRLHGSGFADPFCLSRRVLDGLRFGTDELAKELVE